MRRVVIFGATCQNAYYLADLYRREGSEVVCVRRKDLSRIINDLFPILPLYIRSDGGQKPIFPDWQG
jgi:hypothetical protein